MTEQRAENDAVTQRGAGIYSWFLGWGSRWPLQEAWVCLAGGSDGVG